MPTICGPHCHEIILDQPACPACGWWRPLAAGTAGALVWRGELGHRLSKPRCYPVIAAGRFCAPTEDGAIGALDMGTGERAWERSLGEGRTAHALATDGQRIFVGSVDTQSIPVPGAVVLALDARAGEPVCWEYPTAAHSLSVAVVGGVVYCTSSDGLLHTVDAATGQRRWVVTHPTWGPAAPVGGAGVICAGGRGETLVAYSPVDGAELWRFVAGGWFASRLSIADGRVYALCWDGYLYAFDARGGQLLWKVKGERERGFTTPPVVAGDRMFVGSRVYRLADEQQTPGYALLALRADNGADLWRFHTDRHIFAPPAVAGDGSFYALDAASGAEHWRAQVEGRIVTQPLVFGDMVYVGERSGTVYAFRWRASPAEPLLSPDAYLERGDYEQAAVAYALGSQFEAAAILYERKLGKLREAALLYERAGLLRKAAPLWRKEGDLRRARDRYDEAGDKPGLAEVLTELGEPLQAAQVYEQSGDLDAAAQRYEQSGDRPKAAELYDQLGQYGRARAIWESLGQWERQVEDLISEGKQAEAAGILGLHDQLERAAELYEEVE